MSPIDLRLGRWQDVLADVTTCDSVICDPPYSARTHEGHDDGARFISPTDPSEPRNNATRYALGLKPLRRPLDYSCWGADDVHAFVSAWAPRVRGWFVCFTSHDLCGDYDDAFRAAGRMTFQPLPFLSPGSRVRLSGDGPSSWTCWIMVARPRNQEFQRWGTLPGGYVVPMDKPLGAGVERISTTIVGAKPIRLMRAIVRDYSRPGDLVVDPFCGSGTTAVACASEGRRCITSEMDPKTHAIAAKRIARGHTVDMFAGEAP